MLIYIGINLNLKGLIIILNYFFSISKILNFVILRSLKERTLGNWEIGKSIKKEKKEAFNKDTEFDKNAEAALQGRYDIEAGIIKKGEEAKYKEMLKGQKAQQALSDETRRIS